MPFEKLKTLLAINSSHLVKETQYCRSRRLNMAKNVSREQLQSVGCQYLLGEAENKKRRVEQLFFANFFLLSLAKR